MSDKKRSPHVPPVKDKRADRKAKEILRRPHDPHDDSWDDYDLPAHEQPFKRGKKLD